MNATGIITIEEGLTLNNPSIRIKNIQYDQFDNTVTVEIYFSEVENGFNHSRTYVFINNTGRDLVYNDVLDLIKEDEVLNLFF